MADEAPALRVTAVEQEVEGERIASRHILEQTRRNGADIATMKVDIGVLKSDVATLKADVAILKSDVTAIKSDLRSLSARVDAHQTNLPPIVADTMREVLRELDRSASAPAWACPAPADVKSPG